MNVLGGEGHRAASARLRAARGSVDVAFDDLACGFGHDEALEYLAGALSFQAMPDDRRGLVVGLVLGFALTAVESDRALRRKGRWRVFPR